MYISLRLPQINPSSNLYIPQVNHYILLSLSLSPPQLVSLHLAVHTVIDIFYSNVCNFFFFFFKSKRMQSFARTSRALSFWCLLCCLRLLPSCSCLLCESKKQANEKHLNAFPAVVAVFFYNNFLYLVYDCICFDLGLGSGMWFFERTVFSLSFFFSSIFFFIEAVQWIVRLTCSCLWFLNLIAIVNFSYTYWYIFIVYVSYCGKSWIL